MLKNDKLQHTLKYMAIILCLAVMMMGMGSCGTLDGMLGFLDGDNNASRDISHDSNISDEGDVSVELPDTAAELFTSTPYGEGLMITGYTGTDPLVKIPAQIEGKAVLAIGEKSINDIGDENGEGLFVTTVIVPSSVNQIAFSAFSGCKRLENLTVPFVGGRADNHSYLGYVFGSYSAGGNKNAVPESLKEVTAGGNSLADDAFRGCENIKSITLKDIGSIGASAFKECTGLSTLIIPDSVTSIGASAFEGCRSLVNISLPFLGNGSDRLFFGAVFGAEDYSQNQSYVPDTLRNVSISHTGDVPEGAFYECNNIRSIVIKGDVSSVGEKAFYRCRKLKNLEMSPVSSVAPYAFGYCAALGEVRLTEDVASIPEGAFYACSALRSVLFGEAVNAMPSTVTELGKGAFAYCESLTAMELSPSLTHIEEQTFYGCAYLLSLSLSDNITTVGDDAFKGCNNLKTLSLGKGITDVGDGAFSYCSALKTLVIPKNVTTLGDYAFAYCKYLTEVSVDNGNMELGEAVFNGCEDIVITVDPDSNTYQALINSGLGNSNLKAPD